MVAPVTLIYDFTFKVPAGFHTRFVPDVRLVKSPDSGISSSASQARFVPEIYKWFPVPQEVAKLTSASSTLSSGKSKVPPTKREVVLSIEMVEEAELFNKYPDTVKFVVEAFVIRRLEIVEDELLERRPPAILASPET